MVDAPRLEIAILRKHRFDELVQHVANRAEAAYERSESLVWRDAGCVMMTLHLVAEYLGLAFCPVGVPGRRW